jgi:predicted  nucleic acid-binding Zn-ribbon protein
MDKTCLKCGHVHVFADAQTSNACPNCGAIYAKVEQALAAEARKRGAAASATPERRLIVVAWVLFATSLVLAMTSAALAFFYFQEYRLNRVLISQRAGPPATTIVNPAASVGATAPRLASDALTQAQTTPPADLAENAEVVVISGYEPSDKAVNGTVVNVFINRPGKSVLLVLTSYEKIAWKINAGDGTLIKGILISSYEPSSVRSNSQVPVYRTKLPYSYNKDSAGFASLLNGVNRLFGIQKVDVFRGEYSLPNIITVDHLDAPQAALTVQGEQPQAPVKNLRFVLADGNFNPVRWSLTGPVDGTAQVILAPEKTVRSDLDKRIYRIVSHSIIVQDPTSSASVELAMPDNFPSLSWPTAIAYDSKRHYVTLVSLGGEGFLYRFDTQAGRWLDFRSLENIDINALAYDEVADRYVAWTTDGSLLFIAADGTPLHTRPLLGRSTDFHRRYADGSPISSSPRLVPHGDQVALVELKGGMVERIWYYDLGLDVFQLTYRRQPPAG